jgi:hypothetical protein
MLTYALGDSSGAVKGLGGRALQQSGRPDFSGSKTARFRVPQGSKVPLGGDRGGGAGERLNTASIEP